MGRTLVKMCGVTRVDDALAAARLGADFVGMILHAQSPRMISPRRARQIVDALPASTEPVGVFVDAPPPQVTQACESVRISRVQLHGNEQPQHVRSLSGLRVWKVLRVDGELREKVTVWRMQPLDAVLFDAARGGSGVENEWQVIADARGSMEGVRFIAAGGLSPENVAGVVRMLRPWAVDVSSGVEDGTKGVKSHEKIEAFVRAVRAADESA